MKFYQGELFLTILEAASFVSGCISESLMGDSIDPTHKKYQDILSDELNTYVYLNGLHKYQSVYDVEGQTVHMEGFCLRLNLPYGDAYCVDDYLHIPSASPLTSERILDVEDNFTQYVILSTLRRYQIHTGFILEKVNFERFFEEVLGDAEFSLAEQAAKKNGKSDKPLLFEEVKERCHFAYLVTTFGESYEEMANDVLLSFFEQKLALSAAIEESWEHKRSSSQDKLENTASSSDKIRTMFEESFIPDNLYYALSLFEEAWQDLSPDMKKPSFAQLENHLQEKGLSGKVIIKAIIAVSTPNDVTLGGRQKSELKDWQPKNKRNPN
ncbi:MAG: hypothetical protein ACJAV1_002250 [Paraglaciecola sp.]|jgi:hypothetical protein